MKSLIYPLIIGALSAWTYPMHEELKNPNAPGPALAIEDVSQTSPRSLSSHHHLAITIDRDSPPHTPRADIQPNTLRYKLAIVSGITAVITAGLTALVTILSMRKGC